MKLRASLSTRPSVHGAMRMARLLEMPERELEGRVRELEQDALFGRLVDFRVISVQPIPEARFAARRFAGRELRASSSDELPELIDGNGDLALLMGRIGQERFEACFLRDEGLSDQDRSRECGISLDEARRLRELVDRLYVQAEFESPSSNAPPLKFVSAVGGIEIERGIPVLGFFHRDVWKCRYKIDEELRLRTLESMPPAEARRAEGLLRELEFLDRRKSTLYRVLEALLEAQSDFLVSKDPGRRKALTQRSLAAKLDISPSVLNRLISNKAVQLPWGLEAPLKALLPSGKTLLRDRLYALAMEHQELSDEGLRGAIERLHGVQLSRRSVAQYRKELGIGGRRRRSAK